MTHSSPDTPPIPSLASTSIKGIITFFYYDNVAAAAEFYERAVGLKTAEDFGWCRILELQPRTFLGLMNATSGSQRPVAGTNKGVLLSIETADLDACLARLMRTGAAPLSTIVEPGCEGRTREFKIVDPGGYTVEFFRWLSPPP